MIEPPFFVQVVHLLHDGKSMIHIANRAMMEIDFFIVIVLLLLV